jgi:hypothetical protein
MMVKTWTVWHLKEGAVGAIGEKSRQEKEIEPWEDETKHSPLKRNGGMPVGYSGRTALRREQYDV